MADDNTVGAAGTLALLEQHADASRHAQAENLVVIGSLVTSFLLLLAFVLFYRRARLARTAAAIMETAFSDAPGGVALMGMDGRFLRVNESLCQMCLLHGDGPAQYELLLRMRDAHGDQIPPGTFLYIAERLGLIQEIDRWVVAHAFEMLAEHRAAGRDLRFEVNLSGDSIGDPELLELIERRLTDTGVPPDRLIFEITETAAVANIARAGAFARRLAELGCKFALDDFGAGLGSFYYLKHLPFDYLKIDGEFVRHCATNTIDRTLISAVVQIARGMGKHTIAEFVGDQESVEVLTDLGVDYGQGYFLGKPEPLAQHLAQLPALGTGPDTPTDSPLLAA